MNVVAFRLVAVAAFVMVLSTPALSAETVSGSIKGFECGDNCYLTLKVKGRNDLTGLCTAKTCKAWNELAEMPQRFVGRNVRATTVSGKQYDAGGNDMGDFPAFSKIEILN